MLTHPTWQKIYHGSPFNFTWKQARNSSRSSIGLHVTPNKKIADSFNSGSPVLEAKPKVETIDIGFNNYDLVNPKYTMQAKPANSGNYYDIVLPDTKRIQMLERAGANPTISVKANNIIQRSRADFQNKDEILTDPSIVWNPTWKPVGINLDFRRISPLIHEKIDKITE